MGKYHAVTLVLFLDRDDRCWWDCFSVWILLECGSMKRKNKEGNKRGRGKKRKTKEEIREQKVLVAQPEKQWSDCEANVVHTGSQVIHHKNLQGKTWIKVHKGRKAGLLCDIFCRKRVFVSLCVRILFQLCKMVGINALQWRKYFGVAVIQEWSEI